MRISVASQSCQDLQGLSLTALKHVSRDRVVKFADIARIFSLAHPHGFFGFVRFTIGHKYTNAIE